MNFILTRYIYPINEPIVLSEKLGITLDNARTESEIALIKTYLKVSLDSPSKMYSYGFSRRLPMNSKEDILTYKSVFKLFRKEYSKNDSYARHFFKNNSIQDGFLFLSKMWIIARFDDEGALLELKKQREELESTGETGWFTILDSNHPIPKKSKRLVDYSHLLTMLCRSREDEFSNTFSFLLHDNREELREPKIDNELNMFLFLWSLMAYPYKDKETDNNWLDFPKVRNKLINKAKELENVFDDRSQDKILYLGSLLTAFGNETKDERFRLIILVSILEMMLTRNPDTSKFNIEDSISKQFKLKLGILIYLNDKTQNLSEVKKRLGEIYSQRSNIAHGNLKAFENSLKKIGSHIKEETYMFTSEEIAFERMLNDLYYYVKAVLEEYIKDRDLVEFIKDN